MRALGLEAAGLVNTLSALVVKDADAYGAVSAAYKLPSEPADAARRKRCDRRRAHRRGRGPARDGARLRQGRELAATCATKGNTNAVSDAGVAALLADAACRGAVYNVRINVASLDDKSRGAGLVAEATQLLTKTRALVDQATAAVEAAIG